MPTSPMNLVITVDWYYDNYSTIMISWDSPDDSYLIDYYQYRLEGDPLITHNTTNASLLLSGIPYNENITFALAAVNCIGKGSPIIYIFNIGKYAAITFDGCLSAFYVLLIFCL